MIRASVPHARRRSREAGSTVVWAGEGKSTETLDEFCELLGPDRCKQLEAVSIDMGGAYATSTTESRAIAGS